MRVVTGNALLGAERVVNGFPLQLLALRGMAGQAEIAAGGCGKQSLVRRSMGVVACRARILRGRVNRFRLEAFRDITMTSTAKLGLF